jgi:general secretion pathway protein B
MHHSAARGTASPRRALDRAVLEAFRSLGRRRASVIVWDAPSDHRHVVVTDGPYERMRTEALTALRGIGAPVRGRLSDITPASPLIPGTRRPVLLATADGPAFDRALAPLVSAGIRIDTALTPAAALLSLARLRRTIDGAGPSTGDEAFVAIEESVGCAALIRGGSMLSTRMLPWGFVDQSTGRGLLRSRQEIATRLAGDLAEFVSAARLDSGGLSLISVCGPLPDLRSVAALLVERLDIEVEPLDTLFGIDPSKVPTGIDHLGDRIAELRLAWAAAADARPALDLFRVRRSRTARKYLSRAAVAAGVIAGLGGGWLVQNRWRPVALRSRAPTPPPLSIQEAGLPQPTFTPERPAPAPIAVASFSGTAPLTISTEPTPSPTTTAAVFTAPLIPALPENEPPPASRPSLVQEPARSAPADSGPAPRPPEVALPFDASLQTILFGPERRLAIVDGRIVGEGDEIKGARVVEITQNGVLLRDGQGRLRRLTGSTR